MIQRLSFLFSFIFLCTNIYYSQSQAQLTIYQQELGSYLFIVEHEFHLRYGLAFPLTFKLNITSGVTGLIAKEKHSSKDLWEVMSEKHKDDVFNDVEAVRFDYGNRSAFISASFKDNDSLFIKICDTNGNGIESNYEGITKYYDNRKAAVTITADDWLNGYNEFFPPLLDIFRSYGLYVTVGVVTKYLALSTWNEIQDELDKGYVEVSSHSRTHPFIPYSDPYGEVFGSVNDIIRNLNLPGYFNVNNKEYVYVWIAPSGEYDSTVDSLLGLSSYLAARLYENLPPDTPRVYFYGDSTFSNWNITTNHFAPFLPTVEIGAPSWGGGDTSLVSLNRLFDLVVANRGIYHLMWHPQVIYDDQNKPYLLNHLSHISSHPDLWYVNLGPLYLYHMMQEVNSSAVTSIREQTVDHLSESYRLEQNYPNPFNPFTTISFELSNDVFVNIIVYNILSEKVTTLVNSNMKKGNHKINFNSSKLTSGIYVYQLTAGSEVLTKKMVILK